MKERIENGDVDKDGKKRRSREKIVRIRQAHVDLDRNTLAEGRPGVVVRIKQLKISAETRELS